MKVNTKISSDSETLNKYNKIYPWIPNSTQTRPPFESKDEKKFFLKNVENNFHSTLDYVLKMILKFPSKRINGKHKVDVSNLEKRKAFIPNKFPYQCKGNHWVMWYSYEVQNEEEITNDISNYLRESLGNDKFEFVWYLNPKMTISGDKSIH
jgi:hypothetical protein